MFWALDGFFCGWYTLFFGVAIVWVSITTKFCDKYALAWFPFWGNFLFMGCTFLYLSCGGWWCIDGECDWWGFFFFFVAVVGVIYVILWLVKTLAGVAIPDPIPLEVEYILIFIFFFYHIWCLNRYVVEEALMDIKEWNDHIL